MLNQVYVYDEAAHMVIVNAYDDAGVPILKQPVENVEFSEIRTRNNKPSTISFKGIESGENVLTVMLGKNVQVYDIDGYDLTAAD
jgi:hypothetical protein